MSGPTVVSERIRESLSSSDQCLCWQLSSDACSPIPNRLPLPHAAIQSRPAVTGAQRVGLQIPVRARIRPPAGKKPDYMLRWVSTRGANGPWSETVSATIGG